MGKKGFDVWYHKGDIDFQKIKASGVDFVIPRDGWGTDSIDYKFIEYVQQAKAAGIEVPGVFHFIYAKDVAEAIQNADRAIENVKAAKLPKSTIIWCDLEDDTIPATGDCTEYGLLIQCSDVQWGGFQNLKLGEPRILYMEGHIGAYLGEELEEPGQGIVNCVESTGRWEDGMPFRNGKQIY